MSRTFDLQTEYLGSEVDLTMLRVALEERLSTILRENGYEHDITVYDYTAPTFKEGLNYPLIQVIPSGVDYQGMIGQDSFRLGTRHEIYYAAALEEEDDQSILQWEALTQDVLRCLSRRGQKFRSGAVNTHNCEIDGISPPEYEAGDGFIGGTISVTSNIILKTL